ncbi:MAG: hypothetical protein PQJ59_06285, partial [Spirochaetales bacterium]|nr:hypothetical protein [Spirochaetales bacterium]
EMGLYKINWKENYQIDLTVNPQDGYTTWITNVYLNLFGFGLSIKNISEIENGYQITARFDDNWWKKGQYEIDLDFQDYTDQDYFDIELIPDGEYLDFYLDNQLLASVMFVEDDFFNQLINLSEEKPLDFSQVIWPTRADGSMDYPVPSDILLLNFIPTHKTIGEVQLYSSDTTASSGTTLEADTELRWIGSGTEGRIKVLAKDGQEGWVVEDTLDNLVPENDYAKAVPNPFNLVEEEKKTAKVFPLWIVFLAGVAILGMGAVLIRKRKK